MKKLLCITLSLILFATPLTLSAETAIPYSYVLMEGSTATLLYSDNGSASYRPFHSAKLMTLLLTVEAINRGELSYDTLVTASAHANSMQGAQIWLMPGEQISVHELILSITVGNANDASVALAEALAKSEDDFVALMNKRADELGMSDTKYVDSTGLSYNGTTTACDIAILASELTKYPELTEYFNTWIAYVREDTQLVNTNRLIRSYEPLTGMKAYYGDDCLNCLIATADKNGLTMVCVIMGEPDEFERFSVAKEKLNTGFSAYTMYNPKPEKFICESVKVSKGVLTEIETRLGEVSSFVIRKSREEDIEFHAEYYKNLKAPIYEGDEVGRFVFTIDEEEVFSLPVVASCDVKKLNFFSAFLKLLGKLVAM